MTFAPAAKSLNPGRHMTARMLIAERRYDRDLQHYQNCCRLAADASRMKQEQKGEGEDMKIYEINPETAEVAWTESLVVQRYRQQTRRSCFARAPGSDLWVNFDDLPEATREALWKKHSSKLPEPFPAGFEPPWFPLDEDFYERG